MKRYICIVLLFLSCGSPYQPNNNYPIVLVQLSDTEQINQRQLAETLSALQSAQIKAVLLKPIIENVTDSTLITAFKENHFPVYSSATIVEEKPSTIINEDSLLTKTSFLLLKNNQKYGKFPDLALKPFLKGVGIETGAFRNNVNSINGKSFASLALLLVSDLFELDLNQMSPKNIRLSKTGARPILFSDPKSAYQHISANEIIDGTFDMQSLQYPIVIIYQNTEEVQTLGGIKTKAEITADVVNQLLIELSTRL